MAEQAELQREVQAAIEQTLQSSLEAITKQLDELVAAVAAVSRHATSGASASSVIAAIQPLVQAQAKAGAVSASLEVLSRFLGFSLQMTVAPVVAAPAAAARPAVEIPARAYEPEVVPARAAAPVVEKAPVEVEAAPAVVEEVRAPAPPKVEFDVESLPPEKRDLHKKARRFARVSVQEMIMYKPKEVEVGRQKKDLYQRFQEEIDKGRGTYEKRFAEIADSPVDYFYEELVKNLANNDPGALGNYPYPVPSVRVS